MATKKSKTVKKAKVAKAPKKAVKTTTTAPKKAVKKVVKTSKAAKMVSFKMMPETKPFVAFRITDQTIYWAVLVGYIMLLSLWILKIQIDTQTILDRISAAL